jgi:hypothetical protein
VISIDDTQLSELRTVCPEADAIQEGGVTYIYFPRLRLPVGCEPPEVEALLRPEPGPDGYTTRLFFSHPFQSKGAELDRSSDLRQSLAHILIQQWPSNLRLIEILANHLQVLR